METLLTVEQAASRLQVDPETIRVRLRRGAMRGIKSGRLWRVPESALIETSQTAPDEWQLAAERLSEFYTASIESGGELTAFATADAQIYDYAGDEATRGS